MARARNVKPGFFKNPELVELPFEYRLLFLGLWLLADREGRLEDRPKQIRMEIFPADDVNVDAGLQALHDKELIVRYEVEGHAYIWIPTFLTHQRPHPKEVASTIPPYLGPVKGSTHDLFSGPRCDPAVKGNGKVGANPSDVLNPHSLNPHSNPSGGSYPPGFARFWLAWPSTDRKTAKPKCAEVWRRRSLEAQADRIIAHVESLKATKKWQEGFEPAPLTYLNQKRYEDDAPPRDDGMAGAV